MFDVLAFVFDHYLYSDVCPALPALQRKLTSVGFDDDEIQTALIWLEELKSATRRAADLTPRPKSTYPPDGCASAGQQTACATRIFSAQEQRRLGCAGWGFVLFLVSVRALPWDRLELVMDRVMATPGDELALDDIKLIVLMVFWGLGEEPDALVLDELCDNPATRLAH
jgi:Smg protein